MAWALQQLARSPMHAVQEAAVQACAAHLWVYPLLLAALYEAATCGVSPLTREYIAALLHALRGLPLQVLTWRQAQQAAWLAWRADAALEGQAVLLKEVAAVRAALDGAAAAARELDCAPEAQQRRSDEEVQVRRAACMWYMH